MNPAAGFPRIIALVRTTIERGPGPPCRPRIGPRRRRGFATLLGRHSGHRCEVRGLAALVQPRDLPALAISRSDVGRTCSDLADRSSRASEPKPEIGNVEQLGELTLESATAVRAATQATDRWRAAFGRRTASSYEALRHREVLRRSTRPVSNYAALRTPPPDSSANVPHTQPTYFPASGCPRPGGP